jgi:hypothetical protein
VKAQKSTVVILLLGALHFPINSHAAAAGPDKKLINHRGGQASAHMSPKGSANSNAQWSADPARGWIRADERHELSKTNVPTKNNSDKGKPKAKAKAKGY